MGVAVTAVVMHIVRVVVGWFAVVLDIVLDIVHIQEVTVKYTS